MNIMYGSRGGNNKQPSFRGRNICKYHGDYKIVIEGGRVGRQDILSLVWRIIQGIGQVYSYLVRKIPRCQYELLNLLQIELLLDYTRVSVQ